MVVVDISQFPGRATRVAADFLGILGFPRDPPVLNILLGVNFGAGRKFGTDVAKRYGEGSEMLVFFYWE